MCTHHAIIEIAKHSIDINNNQVTKPTEAQF